MQRKFESIQLIVFINLYQKTALKILDKIQENLLLLDLIKTLLITQMALLNLLNSTLDIWSKFHYI